MWDLYLKYLKLIWGNNIVSLGYIVLEVNIKNILSILPICGQTFGRPWFNNSKYSLKVIYDSYYFEREWKDEKQDTYDWNIEYKIQYILYRWFPKWLSSFLGMLMQRLFI